MNEANKKKTTIYDVAKRSGVTTATVSRVINGKNIVAVATREKVMKAIEELNYYPSPIAAGLSNRKSKQIGVVAPFFFGPFLLKILETLVTELKDYEIIFYDSADPAKKRQTCIKVSGENKLDGLFFVGLPILVEEEVKFRNVKFPVILLDNKHNNFSNVSIDNVMGSFQAVNYLVELGHERIAIITGASEDPFHLTVAKDRLKGYRMALTASGLTVRDEYILINDWSREGAYKQSRKLLSLKHPPTAIFAVSDRQAVGVMEAAREMGMRIPEDLSILGFDDMEFSDYMGITTVSQPLRVLTQLGVNLMLEEIELGSTKKENIVLQPGLKIRKTTAPPVGS